MKRLFKVGSDRHDRGPVIFSWHPEGNFLASAGRNGVVHVTDRHGDIVDEIPLSNSAPVIALEWDRDGEYLAILQERNVNVPLWNLSTKRISALDTELKDLSFLAWSRTGPQLVVGDVKGGIIIYNKIRKQKLKLLGKHSKRICCGAWSLGGNKLVLGAEDRTLSISNEAGDNLITTDLKHVPMEALFTKSNESFREENVVSSNLNGKSLLLYNILDEKDDPMELTFAPKENGGGCRYGELMHHHWYQDNLAIVGFSLGYLLSVSTSPKELGEEKFCARIHSDNLITFAYNPQLQRIASAGSDGIRITDVRDFKEIRADFIAPADLEDGRVTCLRWSPDGQILSISTSAGNVYNFLAKMSVLFATYKSSIAYLSSLREIAVVDAVTRKKPVDITVKLEPSLIAVGAEHVAVGMNNQVYYHRIGGGGGPAAAAETSGGGGGGGGPPINEQEYVGVVKEVQLNAAFAAVLTDSKAILHVIERSGGSGSSSNSRSQSFPTREEGSYAKVTCIALTDNFFFYGTEGGTVEVFFLSEWALLSGIELRLDQPVKKLFPNSTGTRVVVVDRANQVFLYDAANAAGSANHGLTRFETTPSSIVNVLWDLLEKNVIMFFDGSSIHTFLYVPTSMKGAMVVKLGPVTISSIGEISLRPDKIDIVSGNVPLVCHGGELTCQSATGSLSSLLHPFFDKYDTAAASVGGKADGSSSRKSSQQQQQAHNQQSKLSNGFCQALALHQLEKAWEIAVELGKKSFFLALSSKSMELLNVEMASRVYTQLEDAGMVMALKDCLYIEDKSLLAGTMAMLFGDYQRAQDLYLASSRPLAALDMRKDLMQWEQALKLAHILSPDQIPDICIHFGHQLEVRDDYNNALKIFEDALHALDHEGNRVISDALVPSAMIGIARCHLRLGNIRQGIRMANELDDRQLFHDCGLILEQQKQFQESASMYVKAEQFEKAALIYAKHLIKADKSRITEAAAIMNKVDNDALNSAFGKACVAAGRYDEALKAFRRAHDWDKMVEIQLKYVDQIQQAFDLVRSTASATAAQLVAEYCQENNDLRGAIEFLLLASKSDDAFNLAQSNNIVDLYTNFLGEGIQSEEALRVAHYYEKNLDYGKAGRFYSLCAQYSRALKLYLQCGDREIDAAIDVVGKAQNESLTHQLIDFLVGEKDGVPKDPNYIYRLYLALKKYEDAAKTALIIARQEQDLGNYGVAHQVIIETIRYLEDAGIKVPLQMRQSFVILHSYVLVKSLVRRGDHLSAARLLLRIAQHVSKFPMHIVQILTSTVIECQRAGLKASSYEYAVVLVRSEYRPLLETNLKRKIEAIVRRKSNNGDDVPEEASPCPISGQMIPGSQLDCPTTRDALPMCIVTGRHMVLDDWCFCPVSKFPALYSEYVKYIQDETKTVLDNSNSSSPQTEDGGNSSELLLSLTAADPLNGKSVAVKDLLLVSKDLAMRYIQQYNNMLEKKEDSRGEDEADDIPADDSLKAVEDDLNSSPIPSGRKENSKGRASKGKAERSVRSKKKKPTADR